MPRFHKHDVAKLQLQTAVDIFLRGLDRSAVITLAGAASGILDTLVKRAGKEPFVDYARRVHNESVGYTPKRKSYAHHIEKRLGIITHNHLAKDDSETVDLDLDKQAVNALIRATSDYISLNGQEEPFIKAFLSWTWSNSDGPALMERYKAVSDRMKPK
jgi:urocanate hydratase